MYPMKQPRANSAPAWITAAIFGGFTFLAGIVALIYPDTDVYQLACGLGEQSACTSIEIHRLALIVAGVLALGAVVAVVAGIILMVSSPASPPPFSTFSYGPPMPTPFSPQYGPPLGPGPYAYGPPPSAPMPPPPQQFQPSSYPPPPPHSPAPPPGN